MTTNTYIYISNEQCYLYIDASMFLLSYTYSYTHRLEQR